MQRLHRRADLLKPLYKDMPRDMRENQQKLVAAVPHQCIVAVAHAGCYRTYQHAQRVVTGLMAVDVVDLLELVKVQHGDGVHLHELPQLLLKEAAVIGVGQDIMVEVMMAVENLLYRVGLPGSADVHGCVVIAPQGAQPHMMPAKLAVNGQQHRKLGVGVLRAGGAQRLLDARNVRRGEPGFPGLIGQVQILGHAHVLRRPRREGKMTGELVIVKLYAADALVKEPALLLQAGQRLHDMLLPGQGVLPQEGIGNMLGVCQAVHLAAGARSNAQLGMQLRAALGQAFQQQRVELPALAVQDHLHRGVVIERFFVAALARQCVVYIGHRHDLRGDGNLLLFKPVRVAAPVPALMMPAADSVGRLDKVGLLQERQLFQNFRTDRGVGLHDLEFFLRQLAGLVQDGLGDIDLADVMQRRSGADERNIRGGQVVFVGFLHECVQQNIGGCLDMQHVQTAFPVAELHNMAQYVDHRGAAFLFFIDLLGHKADQALLLGVKHQGIDDAAAHDGHVKRTADVVGSAQIIGALDIAGRILRRNHDDGDLVDPVVFVHHGQHFKAVHLGHHNIKQKQVDVRRGLQNGHSLSAVFRLQNLITVTQHLCQDGAVHRGVVRNQDFLFITHEFTYTYKRSKRAAKMYILLYCIIIV